jgi:hypothetical protein
MKAVVSIAIIFMIVMIGCAGMNAEPTFHEFGGVRISHHYYDPEVSANFFWVVAEFIHGYTLTEEETDADPQNGKYGKVILGDVANNCLGPNRVILIEGENKFRRIFDRMNSRYSQYVDEAKTIERKPCRTDVLFQFDIAVKNRLSALMITRNEYTLVRVYELGLDYFSIARKKRANHPEDY